MNKNLNVTIKVLENVDCKYLDTKTFLEENLKGKTLFILGEGNLFCL